MRGLNAQHTTPFDHSINRKVFLTTQVQYYIGSLLTILVINHLIKVLIQELQNI
ncbi:hypothetical protein RhiirA5_357587 [Rhizophagus irregularis]|uniref:Uncharacterized protein n=2 Tax=Rhizophagus irregularis TaxID=588596 RepID=A0A2I1FYU0_9GLOM|nr:hypothetical protein RhiirA5_357587 [Rhizophagus irregularis]GET56754.1 hypothetical protein RIR_e71009_A0A2I1FYU0_9GLOM [Rhizophagus irregularis DAOM 181602=DAOM 197198]PKC68153.1 hypothetical protein RhiirA1_417212 [Rhizophagus irregularis]PKK71711.1 hypothetical protein RhiirC2_744139 [Rhizophagus irregularis]PKY14824.1 hypothetical protein RhiirB3_400785 [Rhizophagus irregularis]